MLALVHCMNTTCASTFCKMLPDSSSQCWLYLEMRTVVDGSYLRLSVFCVYHCAPMTSLPLGNQHTPPPSHANYSTPAESCSFFEAYRGRTRHDTKTSPDGRKRRVSPHLSLESQAYYTYQGTLTTYLCRSTERFLENTSCANINRSHRGRHKETYRDPASLRGR